VKLTSHLRRLPTLRMSSAIPLLPPYSFIAYTGTTSIFSFCFVFIENWLKKDMYFSSIIVPYFLQGGADKSLSRPISRCHRTESILSLERGICSCAELQVFSCYRG